MENRGALNADHISRMRKAGYSREEIYQQLEEAGWSRGEIANAIREFSRAEAEHRRVRKTAWGVALALGVLVAAGVAYASIAISRARARERAQRRRAKRRQIRRNTIEYVDRHQSTTKGAGHRTDAQRRATWDWKFCGQWVRWTGEVVSVTGRRSECEVSMRCAEDTLTSDTSFRLDRNLAVQLCKGQIITIEGRLRDHSNIGGYDLYQVRVVHW